MKSNFTHIKKKRIEFGEVKIGQTAINHLLDACKSNWISSGPKVIEFENRWEETFNIDYAIALSSGTDSCIQMCLTLYEAMKARPGDEIIVPALSFIATSNAVRAAGFTPVFVDICLETLNIDESKIEEAITDRTIAIMPVHTMGRMCEMDTICDIAKKNNLMVLEDACEAHGASFKGKSVGHWGDMAAYSFYIAHMICCGEGGLVSTNHKYLKDIIQSTKSHGRSGLYFDHPRFGLNAKMNDLEASIGLEGMDNFKEFFSKRRDNVKYLRTRLDKFSHLVWFSEEDQGNVNCPHGFSVTLKKPGQRHLLTNSLDKHGVHWKRNFGCIPTQHAAFNGWYTDHSLGDFPNAEHVGDNGIHVGVHQYLTKEDLDIISLSIEEGLSKVT